MSDVDDEIEEVPPDHLILPGFFAGEVCDCGRQFESVELFEERQILIAKCDQEECVHTTYMYRFQKNREMPDRPFIGIYRYRAAFECDRETIFSEFDGSTSDPDIRQEGYVTGYTVGYKDGYNDCKFDK